MGRPAKTAAVLRVHAKRRAFSRFGLELNRHDLRKMGEHIQRGKGLHIDSPSLRVSRWMVYAKETLVCVVYDKQRGAVVTVYPPQRWMWRRWHATKLRDGITGKGIPAESQAPLETVPPTTPTRTMCPAALLRGEGE